MKNYDYIIGIDPDRIQSGVAILEPKNRRFCSVESLRFPIAIERVLRVKFKCETSKRITGVERTFIVVVEAGWLVKKSNFHDAQGRRAEKIAKDVGANHETGRKIIEMCEHFGVNVVEQAPLIKCWKGSDRKITAEELKAITGWDKRTNQDERDAALMAWYYSDLPIRLSV